MPIFKNILLRITDFPSRRFLFILAWIVSYGLAWHILSVVEMYFNYARHPIPFWVRSNAPWIRGIIIGLSFGLTLSFIQTWLIRRRYGVRLQFSEVS